MQGWELDERRAGSLVSRLGLGEMEAFISWCSLGVVVLRVVVHVKKEQEYVTWSHADRKTIAGRPGRWLQ